MLCLTGVNIGSPTVYDGFEVIKGQVFDLDGDKWWDELSFSVETKSANFDIPVIAVRLVDHKQGEPIYLLPFERIEVNKKIVDFKVDLTGLRLYGNFKVEVVLDTGALLDFDREQIVDGGPGSNPNETILIIEYP
jgi:hypothetical protein